MGLIWCELLLTAGSFLVGRAFLIEGRDIAEALCQGCDEVHLGLVAFQGVEVGALKLFQSAVFAGERRFCLFPLLMGILCALQQAAIFPDRLGHRVKS